MTAFEDECRRELFDIAMTLIEKRVEPQTWEAFRLSALEDIPVTAVADQLGVNVASVYQAKSRIQKLIREELKNLESNE